MGEECCGDHAKGAMDGARRQAFDVMRARGLRVTNQRGALLDFLMSGHGPFSAEEVHRGIGGKGGDLVTVYRVETLDFCVADGLERIARRMGYADVTHTLEVFGTCSVCVSDAPRGD